MSKPRQHKGTRYYAVSESGSCSIDHQRWEEKENCGHAHKTHEAAARCLAKKQQSYCLHDRPTGSPCAQCLGNAQHNHTSAAWYNGSIHDQHGARVEDND